MLVEPGSRMFESLSFIQKRVGVGFPAAMQSRTAGAPSATFWSVGSTRNMGGAANLNLKPAIRVNHSVFLYSGNIKILKLLLVLVHIWLTKGFLVYFKVNSGHKPPLCWPTILRKSK